MIDLRKQPGSRFFCIWVSFFLILSTFGFTPAATAAWPGQVDLSHDTRGTGIQDVNALAPQSNGHWIVAGDFYGSRYIARIDAEGNLDPLFLEPEGHDQVHSVAVQENDKIIVGGIRWDSQGRPQGALTRLTADGAPDSTFDAGLVTYGVFGATIRSVVLQANGKILVGGTFSEIQGEPRGGIARLHPDGTLDATFGQHLAGANNTVSTVVEQADGKILIGGQFTTVNQMGTEKLARLNSDGSLDETFGPVVLDAPGISTPYIRTIAVQNDGKILIGGFFSTINGFSRNNIARLHPDGSLDLTFADGLTGADQVIDVIAVQQDGGILIGGAFRIINGASRSGIARLNPDGTLEPTFGLGMLGIESSSARRVSAIGVEDGMILIGGNFSSVNEVPRWSVARLYAGPPPLNHAPANLYLDQNWVFVDRPVNTVVGTLTAEDPNEQDTHTFSLVNGIGDEENALFTIDGNLLRTAVVFSAETDANSVYSIRVRTTDARGLSAEKILSVTILDSPSPDERPDAIDLSFYPGSSLNDTVRAVARQKDGGWIIGGDFTTVQGGAIRNRIAKIHADGKTDHSFLDGMEGVNDSVYAIAVQNDGKVLIGGAFTRVNGENRDRIARLNPDGSLDSGFNAGVLGASPKVHAIAIQEDGKFAVCKQ